MQARTDDLRIREIKELAPPSHLLRELACSEKAAQTVSDSRTAIHRCLHGMDDRLVVVIGPCSSTTRSRHATTPTASWSCAAPTPPSWKS